MEKMSLLKLIYAQIMANNNNGIYPHNLYERRGPKFNPNYTVKDKDSMRKEREFNINGVKGNGIFQERCTTTFKT